MAMIVIRLGIKSIIADNISLKGFNTHPNKIFAKPFVAGKTLNAKVMVRYSIRRMSKYRDILTRKSINLMVFSSSISLYDFILMVLIIFPFICLIFLDILRNKILTIFIRKYCATIINNTQNILKMIVDHFLSL